MKRKIYLEDALFVLQVLNAVENIQEWYWSNHCDKSTQISHNVIHALFTLQATSFAKIYFELTWIKQLQI